MNTFDITEEEDAIIFTNTRNNLPLHPFTEKETKTQAHEEKKEDLTERRRKIIMMHV